MKRLFFLSALCALLAGNAWSQQLRLPAIFGSQMVMQREMPFAVKGKAAAGAAVEVTLSPLAGDAQTAREKLPGTVRVNAGTDGRFQAMLPPMQAGGPYTLSVRSGKEELKFDSVYVGEVWICSGQSNMEMRLREISTAKRDLAMADTLQRVHLYNMESTCPLYAQVWTEEQIATADRGGFIKPARWVRCSAAHARNFSAIGFHFARVLADSLKCHVGIVSNAVGGSTTEGWIDSTTLAARVPEILQGCWLDNPNIMGWARNRAKFNLKNTNPTEHAHPYAPGYLFRAAIRPLEGYPVKGVLWYQGESNAELVSMHERLFRTLQESWRKEWNRNDLPFYFVQLSSISTRPTWPAFRNSQRILADSLPHTYMTVSSDVGDSLDVHPRNKRIVAQRLAASALHHAYGYSQVVPNGPRPLKAVSSKPGMVTVYFDTAEGLRWLRGDVLKHFELGGKTGLYVSASKVLVQGNTVQVFASRMSHPTKVRFAWKPFTRAALVNRAGMPCSTFELEVKAE